MIPAYYDYEGTSVLYDMETGLLINPIMTLGGRKLYINKKARLKAKKKRQSERKQMNCLSIPSINSLGHLECTKLTCTSMDNTPCLGKSIAKAISQTTENTMNTATATNTFESERRALRELLYSIEREKSRELRKHCHIDAYRPKTRAEIVQLLKDGKVTLHPDYMDKDEDIMNEEFEDYQSPYNMIAFNYQKPDNKAWKEGLKKIEKESDKLKTHIAIFPPEESFKKLEAFEKQTIH